MSALPLSVVCPRNGNEQVNAVLDYGVLVTEVRSWDRVDSYSGLTVPEASVRFEGGAFSRVTFWSVVDRDTFVAHMRARLRATA